MWTDDYRESNIKPSVIPEGNYRLKIINVVTGTIPESGKRYFKIDCLVNYDGIPNVAFFLTEGANFDGEATAFFDTFGIARGDWNYGAWKNHYGWMKITHRKKGEYTNMVPRFILDESGYAMRNTNTEAERDF